MKYHKMSQQKLLDIFKVEQYSYIEGKVNTVFFDRNTQL